MILLLGKRMDKHLGPVFLKVVVVDALAVWLVHWQAVDRLAVEQ